MLMVAFCVDKERINMEKIINIKSKLFDYSVEFVETFGQTISAFEGKLTYVIDRNVYKLYKDKLVTIDEKYIYLVDATEENKTIESILDLIDFWHKNGIKKNWKVICIGGGITQDITTFASNIFLRNIDWYFFPTTLLAMCDSCIGGKCGINRGIYKNQLGVFYPPKKIFIDTHFLSTLTKSDYINGWGELLKFSLTLDKKLYEKLETEQQYIPCENIDEYIYEGLKVKQDIIEKDEFEGDIRRVLNYGHTFGHALEAYTNHSVPHGTAVIWGIDIVNYISYREQIISKEDYLRVKNSIKSAFLQEEIIVENGKALYEIISTDKKVKDDTVFLAIPDKIGSLIIYPMDINGKLKNYFADYLEETHEYYCN